MPTKPLAYIEKDATVQGALDMMCKYECSCVVVQDAGPGGGDLLRA